MPAAIRRCLAYVLPPCRHAVFMPDIFRRRHTLRYSHALRRATKSAHDARRAGYAMPLRCVPTRVRAGSVVGR